MPETSHTREISALEHQQVLLGQLAQELRELTDPESTLHLQNELALAGDDYVRRCNFLALELLNEHRFDDAFEWLSRAERVATGGQGVVFFAPHALLRRKALAAVSNNFGLFYFKRGEFAAAQKALAHAVAEEEGLGDGVADNRGATLLNLAQAEMALRAVAQAEGTLLRAIQALEAQLEKCVVTVQIANTGLLAARAYFLLAQCREHGRRYAHAADAVRRGLAMHARIELDLDRVAGGSGSGHHRGGGPARKPQLVLDMEQLLHTCMDKERVFPTLLRPASAKPSAVRSRSAAIVVTSLTEPVPQIPPQLAIPAMQQHHPSPAATRPASAGRPTTASAVRPSPPAAAAQVQHYTPRQQTQQQLQQHQHQQQDFSSTAGVKPAAAAAAIAAAAAMAIVPAADPDADAAARPSGDDAVVESARQQCLRQKPAPPATRHVFRTSATGLSRVYGSLSEQHKSAFDRLCATKPAVFPPASAAAVLTGAVRSHPAPAEAVDAPPPPKAAAVPERSATKSISPLLLPASRPAVVGGGLDEPQQQQQQHLAAAAAAAPAKATKSPPPHHGASVSPKPTAIPQVPNRPGQPGAAALRQGGGRGGTAAASETAAPALRTAMSVKELKRHIGPVIKIQRAWRRHVARRQAAAILAARRLHAQHLRETIRKEEEARAVAMATRLIEEHQRQLKAQGVLAESMRLFSRHGGGGVGASMSLLPSAESLSSATLLLAPPPRVGGGGGDEHGTPSSSDAEAGGAIPNAMSMLLARQQVRDSQNKVAESTHATLQRAQHARQEKRAQRKRNTSLTLQFVLGCLATRVVGVTALATRNALLDVYGQLRLERIACRKLVRVLRLRVILTRQARAQRLYEEQQAAIYGLALVRLFQFAAAKSSALHVARTAALRTKNAAIQLQRTFRGHGCRRLLSHLFAKDRKRRRLERLRAAEVIQRAALRYIGRVARNARWTIIRSANMGNKAAYAAAKIQHAWRWYTTGKPREQERQRRRLELVQTANMRQTHDQLIQELVAATEIIQRFYRGHLGRRQKALRLAKRATHAHQYILAEWLAHAVRVLQRFCPLVIAKRSARLRKEMKQYILGALSKNERRVRAHLFPNEWGKYDAALDVLQRVGRGSLVRRAYMQYRVLTVAALDGRLAAHSALIALAIAPHLRPAEVCRVVSEDQPAVAPAGQPAAGVSSECQTSPVKNFPATQQQRAPVPRKPVTSDHYGDRSSSSSVEEEQRSARTAVTRHAGSIHDGPRKYRKHRPQPHMGENEEPSPMKLLPASEASAVAAVQEAAEPSSKCQQREVTAREVAAKATIARFFRWVVAHRMVEKRRQLVDKSILRNDAAIFLQKAWRGYFARSSVIASKKKIRDGGIDTQLRSESAVPIQALFRGHKTRKDLTPKKQ